MGFIFKVQGNCYVLHSVVLLGIIRDYGKTVWIWIYALLWLNKLLHIIRVMVIVLMQVLSSLFMKGHAVLVKLLLLHAELSLTALPLGEHSQKWHTQIRGCMEAYWCLWSLCVKCTLSLSSCLLHHVAGARCNGGPAQM